MSKRAEAVSLEAYPPTYTTVKRHAKRVQSERTDTHQPARAIFQQGYEQAEKDLDLTWEDAKKINDLFMEVATFFSMVGRNKDVLEQPFYEEIAKRFNEQRQK